MRKKWERGRDREKERVYVLVKSVCACVVGSRNVYVREIVGGLCVKEYVYLHVWFFERAYVPVNCLAVMIKINTRQKISKGHIT